MSDKNILLKIEDKILTIEISRRDKKNALTRNMYGELANALTEASSSRDISCVVLCGQSDLFTSGNDVKDFLNRNINEEPAAIKFLKIISTFKKPIIAAIGGDAIGIGTTMLMHCDFVIASDKARFQLPFVNLGLCPEAASSYLLQQLAGSRLATELLMLGDFFDVQTAIRAGIVNYSCMESALFDEAAKLAKKLIKKPTDALQTTKSLLKKNHDSNVIKVMNDEFLEFNRLLLSPAAKEIFAAFLEKRAVDPSKIY